MSKCVAAEGVSTSSPMTAINFPDSMAANVTTNQHGYGQNPSK